MSEYGENQVRPVELDRLVDGELSEPEQQALIRRLDCQPNGWRDCALAFLESHSWSHSLRSESVAPRLPKSMPLPSSADRAQVSLPAERLESSSWPNAIGWLATAAALFVAFTLGQRVMPVNEVTQGDRKLVTPEAGAVAIDSLTKPTLGMPEATERWLTGSQVPADIRRALQRMGADVQQEQGWLLRPDADGQHFVVPYRDVQIVPVNNPL